MEARSMDTIDQCATEYRSRLTRWLVVLAISAAWIPASAARSLQAGDTFPAWTAGTLDIHQIATGRGNAAFFQFPGGATLLVDVGDAGDVDYADPLPDGSRPPGTWVARYVEHMMAGRTARLDYLL